MTPEEKREYYKRWRAAHPEKYHEYRANRLAKNPNCDRDSTRKWRAEHPELAAKLIKKANNKAVGKRILKRKINQVSNIRKVAIIADVKRHLAKGRSISDIVCWTNTPYSCIEKIVNEIRQQQTI